MASTDTYLATAGTRKVHLEFAWQAGFPTCDRGETINTRIAPIEGEGLEGTLAALTAAGIAPSRLCGHCFGARTRNTYRKQRTAV